MARIAGVNIPTNKRVVIALTYIHGIGSTSSQDICERLGVPAERRVNELTEDEVIRSARPSTPNTRWKAICGASGRWPSSA